MKEIVLPRLRRFMERDATIAEILAELTMLTVHQHMQISLSRLAQDPKRDVSLLGIEGEHWVKRRDYTPGRTASRLHQAVNWLRQFELIAEGGITTEGQNQLERALATLARSETS